MNSGNGLHSGGRLQEARKEDAPLRACAPYLLT